MVLNDLTGMIEIGFGTLVITDRSEQKAFRWDVPLSSTSTMERNCWQRQKMKLPMIFIDANLLV